MATSQRIVLAIIVIGVGAGIGARVAFRDGKPQLQVHLHHAILHWNPVKPTKDITMVRYNVYRRLESERTLQRVESQLSTPTFDDGAAIGGSVYFYAVTAVDPNGQHESRFSEEIKVTVPQ